MKRNLALGLAGVAVLIVGILVIFPLFLGPVLKARLAGPLEKAFGHQVTVEGAARLSILPTPVVTVYDVRIDDAGITAHIPVIEARLRLVPFLAGRLELTSAHLQSPEISVTLPSLVAAADSFPAGDVSPAGAPAKKFKSGPLIERVVIDKGTLLIRQGDSPGFRVEALQLSVAVGGPQGPFNVSASGRAEGTGFTVDAVAPSWEDQQTEPVSLSVILDQGAGEARLSGQMSGQGTDRVFTGKMTAHLSEGHRLAHFSTTPLTVDANITATTKLIKANALSLAIGGVEADGTVALSLGGMPHLDMVLSMARLDLDSLLAQATSGAAESGPPVPARSPSASPAAAAAARAPVPAVWPLLPVNVSADIDINAELVTFRGAILRSGKFKATMADGVVELHQASISLPGDTTVLLAGRLAPPLDRIAPPSRFEGDLHVSTNDARGLATWLGWDAKSVPADRLHGAHYEGKIVATPDHVALNAGHLQLDTSHADITIGLQQAERPLVDVAFTVDAINLDAYRSSGPTTLVVGGETPPPVPGAAPAPVLARQDGDFTGFSRFDAHVKGTVGQVLFHGINNKNTAVEAHWSADSRVGDIHLESEGLVLAISGRIPDTGVDGGNLQWEIHHPSFVQMIRLVAPEYRPAGALGAFAATAKTTGDLSALQINDLTLSLGAVTARGQVKIDRTADRPRVDGSLSFGTVPLYSFLPAGSSPSSPVPATGKRAPAKQGDVSGATLPASPRSLDLSWLKNIDGLVKLDAQALLLGSTRLETPHGDLTLRDGGATLDHLAARLYGGAVSGSATLTAAGVATGQFSLSHGQLKEALTDWAGFGLADGVMDATLDVTAQGATRADWVRTLAGRGTLGVHDGHIAGFDLQAVDDILRRPDGPSGLLALLTAGLNGGKTAYSGLSGTVHIVKGVIVNDDLKLVAVGGGADGAFQVDLPADTVDGHLAFHLAHAADAPPLVLRMTGPLEAPRRFLDINPIQTWLVQHTLIKGGKPKDILKKLFGH